MFFKREITRCGRHLNCPAKRHRCLIYGIQSWPIRIEYPQGMYQFYSLGETVGESKRLGVPRSSSMETHTLVHFVRQRLALSTPS